MRGALQSPRGSPRACACWLTPGNQHLPLWGGGVEGLGAIGLQSPLPGAWPAAHTTHQHPCPQRDPCPRRGQPPGTPQAPAVQQVDWAKVPPRLPYTTWPPSSSLWLRISSWGTSNEAWGSMTPSEHGYALVSYCCQQTHRSASVATGHPGVEGPFPQAGFLQVTPQKAHSGFLTD